MVWCLPGGALLFWFCCFDWSLVLPERRAQLEKATNEGTNVLNQTYWNMQGRYKAFRRELFTFLTVYSNIETTLPQFSASLHVYLDDFDVCIEWEVIISQGRGLIDTALKHARGQLQDQATIPVIDTMSINASGEVTEGFALPLLPIVQEEDITQFFENLGKMAEWHHQMTNFLAAHESSGIMSEKSGIQPRRNLSSWMEGGEDSMEREDVEDYTNLQRDDLDPELFAAALAAQHIRKLISYGGSEYGRASDEEALQPEQIEAFVVRAVENAKKTKRFEQEWRQLQYIFPQIKGAWERGQKLFQEDLVRVTNNQEEMEYLSMIDFAVDCYAYVTARNTYPDNGVLHAWLINGYMLAWRSHFLSENQ